MCMETHSASLATGENHSERLHLTLAGGVTTNKADNNKCWQRRGEPGTFVCGEAQPIQKTDIAQNVRQNLLQDPDVDDWCIRMPQKKKNVEENTDHTGYEKDEAWSVQKQRMTM